MKPPILIVHGAFHILTHFTSLVTLLRHEGHKVLVPALPSTDISSDSGNANTLEAAKIRHELSTLIEETEKMAVGWLLHSDGGQVCLLVFVSPVPSFQVGNLIRTPG